MNVPDGTDVPKGTTGTNVTDGVDLGTGVTKVMDVMGVTETAEVAGGTPVVERVRVFVQSGVRLRKNSQ
jgi:hypothetical protein